MDSKNKKTNKTKISPLSVITIVLLVISLMFVSVYGWFYYSRQIMAVYEISNPTSLYISAAQREDIRYLDLSGIDVSDGNQKDFVFSIRGLNISGYKIQLAYTTNNQFSFELYRAKLSDTSKTTVTASDYESHNVVYRNHSNNLYYFYDIDPDYSTALAGTFLNEDVDRPVKAKTDDDYYRMTYGEDEDDTNPYEQVNEYAMPLYWQTTNAEPGALGDYFTNDYILRVKWTKSINDKETDIIYIAAKTTTT